MYQVSSEIFDQMEVELILVRKEKRNRVRKGMGMEREEFRHILFIKEIYYNGVSKWKRRKEKKKEKKIKRKESSIVW